MSTATVAEKKKRSFKMPHLLWIILGLIVIMSLLTYVIPAGQFGTDEAGNLVGTEFNYLGYQTPVSLWRACMLLLDGLTGSATIAFMVMVSGGAIRVILDSNAIDDFVSWAIFKLRDKSANTLVPLMFLLMVYLGGFGGSDAYVALVPIGVAFARKLKLDPIVAMGVTTYATLIGFGTGPNKLLIPQAMMDIPIYSGFAMRFLIMTFFGLVGLFFLMRYVKKIQKDPSASALGNTDWLKAVDSDADEGIKEQKLSWKTIAILLVFIGQYLVIVTYSMKNSATVWQFSCAVHILAALLVGALSGKSADQVANSFAQGLGGMAFVGFVIGMARVVSLIMSEGNILHTIVYVLTRPLMNVNRGLSLVGITAIISVINMMVPSASSKAAILMPIIRPVTETLGIHGQLAVQAFQFGDGFTNLLSPALGWTMGSLATAGVPYDKWLKWVIPKIIIMMVLSFVIIYFLYAIGWTGLAGLLG